MSTELTSSLVKQLIAAVLDTPPEPLTGGGTVREMIGARLYVRRPPDNATYPYGVVNLALRTDPAYDNTRLTGTFECTIFTRPLTRAEEAEEIADRVMQALAGYRSASRGLVYATGITRDALPVFRDPADSEVTGIRVAAALAVWPQLLIGGNPAP